MKNTLQLADFRKSLKDFFKNVIDRPEDAERKKLILKWVRNMYKIRGISIPNFEYLFSEYKSITFPVQFDSSSHISFIDSSGNEFSFMFLSYYLDDYSIGTSNDSFSFCKDFKLSAGAIITCRMHITKLDCDDTVTFEYFENFTNATLYISDNKVLSLRYHKQNQDFDTEVANYIFTLLDDSFCDVMPIFIKMANSFPVIADLTISSFYGNGDISSEIVACNGFVKKYCFTTQSNESFSTLNRLTCSIPIKDFITNPVKSIKDLL